MNASVGFVQRRLPHYREAFFAGLHEHLRTRGVSLEVLVADFHPGDAPQQQARPAWCSSIRGRRLAAGGREMIWQDVLRATSGHDLVITELSPRIISNLALIARSRAGGAWVGGFGHGRDFSSTRVPGPKTVHGCLVRSFDWWFAYNELSKGIVGALGVSPDRVTSINNTIDIEPLARAVDAHRRAGLLEFRQTLGIAGGPVAIFCGSLDRRKRMAFVFAAAMRLRERFPGLSLVVLGDGPGEADVRAFAGAHDWVHYFGRVVGVERARYLAAADVMLMPGTVGLVVLDCFAARVPLMTTEWRFHSPEIAYLRHGENGWCSPDTLDAYVDAVSLVLGDPELHRRLQRGCADAAGRYPMEGMVTRFADGVLAAIRMRRGGRLV